MVTLNIFASDKINLNERGEPRPVSVRIYQLRNGVRMENATFDEILINDKEIVGDDLATVEAVDVLPSGLLAVKFNRLNEASNLAGVAMFRSPNRTSWKTLYAIPIPTGPGGSTEPYDFVFPRRERDR